MREPGIRYKLAVVLSACALLLGLALLVVSSDPLLTLAGSVLIVLSWGCGLSLAERFRVRLSFRRTARSDELASARSTISKEIQEARVKQSRHEYIQERALDRLEFAVRNIRGAQICANAPYSDPAADVLFVTSNGAGLGHVSRALAIAAKLPAKRRVEVLTLSEAHSQVSSLGVQVHYFPSSDTTGEPPRAWNPIFQRYFGEFLFRVKPRIVVFDGTWVYTGVTDVCRAANVPIIWIQRGNWKEDVDRASRQRHNATEAADFVIVPGDYAANESVELGADLVPHYVGPIVGVSRDGVNPRALACAEMSLEPTYRYVLISVGSGTEVDGMPAARLIVDTLRSIGPELVPVVVVSPLADASELSDVLVRRMYPVMQNVSAFEYVVSAAGYNSVQELVSLGIPSLLVPNLKTTTDDQFRRANALAEAGLCMSAQSTSELHSALKALSSESVRSNLRKNLARLEATRGAEEAADYIEQTIDRTRWRWSGFGTSMEER